MVPQIVLITGCSAGIGLATAKRLAFDVDQRYIVIATVIVMSEKAELVAAVGDALDKTVFIRELDVTNDKNISDVVRDVIRVQGRIDILINVAGLAFNEIPERVTREQIDKLFNVNTIGPIRLAQAVLPHMKERQAGKIVTVSSDMSRQAWPYFDIYSATKFGVEGFFEALAASVRAFSIRVCLVEPGPIATGLLGGLQNDMKRLINDETVNEIDHRQLVGLNRDVSDMDKTRSADDVAADLTTRCLDVDEPVLRHLLLEDKFMKEATEVLADLTGERGVAFMRQQLGH
ncbi:retinol dehydrogenase 8 [Strongylocentrotus purpuratus]|uniref:Retinol dehydrogenase 8 n=1 Tax=Strongylocentrotus purpuratus TaxID=7668 RepID=A0A7M7GGA6_STRPU|nr:retinol dehydrogenase 8 [Strongylocentrotus purpuratus]XP_030839173.1 retinol dehydrogenase 8 [Strongylocentrotus purpuratus]XP_781050.2 retinol dehydrogenase 8 [Strongylocentrotus purpuratus]